MQAGQIIAGKYCLKHPLGAGGMASVWCATNVFTDRDFAIKFMLPQAARTPEAARRFLLEAKVSGRIDHPNTIEMMDVGQTEDGALFLVMELLSGESLDAALRRRDPPMSIRDLVAVMRDIASALEAVHGKGIIHRDLKPTNIFLHTNREGRVVPKLLDFGVSKILHDDGEGALTVVGTVLGSPFYMSPEQAMGESGVDGRTDVFAFGSILFEAICGERAYAASSLHALIVAIATTPPKSIDDVAPHAPESLRSLVRECLERDRTKRIGSFVEVAGRLDAILQELAPFDLRVAPLAMPPGGSAGAVAWDGSQRRASDRPPADVSESSPPISIPMSPPIFVPERSTRASAPPRRARVLAGSTIRSAVGVLVIAAAVVCAAGLVRHGGSGRAIAMAEPIRPPATTSTTAIANASAREASATAGAPTSTPEPLDNVPTVSVDALPIASHAAKAKLGGRVNLASGSAPCVITVDGTARGTTPLHELELAAGSHLVECVTADGRRQTATISVTDGSETRYRFSPSE